MSRKRSFLALCFLGVTSVTAHAADTPEFNDQRLEQQRTVFRTIYPEVERGNWQPAAPYKRLLDQYALWPDLRATYYRARIDTVDHDEVHRFLDQYGLLKPARELRYRFALHLADEGWLSDYLAIYQQFYQGLGIARLDCLALQAEIHAGRQDRVVTRALDLWHVGKSQEDECDPVFANLRARNLLTDREFSERFVLAVEERRFTLARYLSRSLDPAYLEEANSWLVAQNDPRAFIAAADTHGASETGRRQLAYAVEQLAYEDPLAAYESWRKLTANVEFTAEQVNESGRHIALWAARLHLPEASTMLAALPSGAVDTEVGRWIVRTSLFRRDWPEVLRAIDGLPGDESKKDEWQYWKAVALEQDGQDQAAVLFAELAKQRGYYGFLAADAIGANYAFSHAPMDGDEALTEKLVEMPELVRARELFLVGLEGRGRSEWDAAVQVLTADEQAQAAILAHKWGWHSRAIATTAKAGNFDDLGIRYPLPWRQDFEQSSTAAGIPYAWAYGIARSESLFMRDIRSSAGAIGVMQLLPETGRRTAKAMNLPYAGRATLTNSSSNIRLGTWYLASMFERFDDNRVLATAAYNAGPLKVEAWLPENGSLDARIWIENIPYNETRGYVRRVLTDDAIFYWRLTGRQRRISSELPAINLSRASLRSSEGKSASLSDSP